MMCLHWVVVRTQIQLTDQQARRLRAQARDRGLSLAEVIRRCVDKGLAEEMPDRAALYEDALRLVGRFQDRLGARDVSQKHDDYLDESFE
jgi:Ribbon-helix-helix protein, copG family